MSESTPTANRYSPRWFDLFLRTQPFTSQEVAFVQRQLPNPPFNRVMDLCCGPARHSRWLAKAGYQITGMDLDWHVLKEAQEVTSGAADWVQLDMRHLAALTGPFDAVLCLWQSFGHFDPGTNAAILREIGRMLRPGGRFILDIYHRGFFEAHQGARLVEIQGNTISITNTMQGDRLLARLDYVDGREIFEWQLFTPDEIIGLAQEFGLACLLACTWFDEQQAATPEQPRMQLVFERIDDPS